ncbi:MAG: GatB/YqeY domain-containing protein [Pseudomonadota bacterium]
MSTLKETIAQATKDAMKSRAKARLGVLRLINAEIKRLEVDERRDLEDADVLDVLGKMRKQRQDAQQQFEQAERVDLAQQEAFEITVVEEFLPAQLDADAIAALVDEIIAASGATGMQDMGKVMGQLKAQAGSQLDMGEASAIVKAKLA